ncbi:MAG: hypothetical protein V7739_10125 [Motiliproteus sp.]
MKKGLILPLLLPLIIFAAVKGYFWYQVKRFVDDVAVQISPFATLEYESIDTSFTGIAGISNVRIYPSGSEYPLNISSIRVVSDDWVYFVKLGTPLDKGDLPRELAFEVIGIDIDLNAPYINMFSQQAAVAGNTFAGCEKSQVVGLELLKQLGYGTLHTDVKLSYRFNPESEYVTVNMDAVGENSFAMKLSSDIDLGVSVLNRENMKSLQPKLGGFSFGYRDMSFNEKYIAHCAALYDEEVPQFVDRHVTLTADRYRQFGFEFNQELVEAYRSFISTQGDMNLSFNADTPLGVQQLAMAGPNEYLKMMDVKLVVNGKNITPVNVGWNMPEMGQNQSIIKEGRLGSGATVPPVQPQSSLPEIMEQVAQKSKSIITPEEKRAVKEAAAPRPKVKAKKYIRTSVPELSKYVGSMIQVDTKNGHRIEGEIKKLIRNGVQIEKTVGNGTALLPIVYSNVLAVKVLR